MTAALRDAARSTCPALLAFDTSTETMAVAACGPRGDIAHVAPGGAAASSALLPLIDTVLAAAGLALHDLAAVAFGRGPGAFTGLRTSCAVAQGLGLGLGRPLLPIDSLCVVAEDAWPGSLPASLDADEATPSGVAVAMDARMDEVYGAIYRRTAAGWSVHTAAALYTLDAWNAAVEEAGAAVQGLAGNAWPAFGLRLRRPPAAPWQAEQQRAGALLRLAQRAWGAGEAIDAAAALPLYLRDKVALTTAERHAAKAHVPGQAGQVGQVVGA